MRVIAGEFKSRRLSGPDNEVTRPTTDRSRESLFNVLAHMIDLTDARVLDLFAGSGAVGIEAISRGAVSALLIEKDRRAIASARENIEALGLKERVRIQPVDVFSFVRSTTDTFDLIFSDAPYKELRSLKELPELIFQYQLLKPEGLLVIEHSAYYAVLPPDAAKIVRELKVGEAGFTMLKHRSADERPDDTDPTTL